MKYKKKNNEKARNRTQLVCLDPKNDDDTIKKCWWYN